MAAAASPMIGVLRPPEQWPDDANLRRYLARMTTTANAVLHAMNARRPGLKPGKQHLLLFFAQGHHLAWAGTALFTEDLYATDRGVTLREADLREAEPILSEAELGTITDVIVRYSALSPAELRTLVQASAPWQSARKAGGDARIDPAVLSDWFRRADETDDPDDERPTQAERAEAEAYLTGQGRTN